MTSFSVSEEGKTLLRTRPLGSLTCIEHVAEVEAGAVGCSEVGVAVGVAFAMGCVAGSEVSERGVVFPVRTESAL